MMVPPDQIFLIVELYAQNLPTAACELITENQWKFLIDKMRLMYNCHFVPSPALPPHPLSLLFYMPS